MKQPALGRTSIFMPRFFFHLEADDWVADEEGIELQSLGHAKAEALRCARMIAAEDTANGLLNLRHAIVVHDEASQTVTRVAFADTVQVTG
jgi:hypothetical protein